MTYEFEGKTDKEAIENAERELGLEKDQFDVEIIEIQKNSLFKKGFVRIRVHVEGDEHKKAVQEGFSDGGEIHKKENNDNASGGSIFDDPLPQNDFEKAVVDFVSSVIRKMGYEITVEVVFREEKKLGLRLISPNFSILIGRKGKNLDALQLLANVFASKIGQGDTRIILDSENYRIRREETLVRLAYNTADRVRTTKTSVLLEPMNPFERRLIHTSLNDIADVETKSEGEGLYKQVRVLYKGR